MTAHVLFIRDFSDRFVHMSDYNVVILKRKWNQNIAYRFNLRRLLSGIGSRVIQSASRIFPYEYIIEEVMAAACTFNRTSDLDP